MKSERIRERVRRRGREKKRQRGVSERDGGRESE